MTENASLGEISVVSPNLNILENKILIVDNKNIFIYLSWLGISRIINKKPPNFEVLWSWLEFFSICG